MNKKIKIICTSLCLLALTATGASARQVRELNRFRLPAWQEKVKTDYCTKSKDDAPWVINPTKLTCDTVDTYLVNSDDEKRSDYVTVGTGRTEIDCSGKANYRYRALIMNSTSSRFDQFITGSWSPDN